MEELSLLFYAFSSQKERSIFDGSCFLELQYCRLPKNTSIDIIVSVHSISPWQDDSLYVHGVDQNLFFKEYRYIFDCGVYNNLQTGTVDPWGINYYGPNKIDGIIAKLNEVKPTDYQTLVEWISTAKIHNGFYILGV